MAKITVEELCSRKKGQTIKLIEVADVTRRMAEAFEHRDEVSVQVLLGEREQPVQQLHEIEEGVNEYLLTLPEAEAIRMNELLRGAEAETAEEKPLAEQVAQYRRVLETTVALDKQLSVRMGGGKSFYKLLRE